MWGLYLEDPVEYLVTPLASILVADNDSISNNSSFQIYASCLEPEITESFISSNSLSPDGYPIVSFC